MKRKSEKRKIKNFGFTLIELLVVVSIIGVLAALIMVNFNAARARARDARRKGDLDQIKKACLMYYNDTSPNVYPPSVPFGGQFDSWDGNVTYMKVVPDDPTPGSSYSYTRPDSQNFCLWATLENKSDSDIDRSQTRCSGCSFGDDDYVLCVD